MVGAPVFFGLLTCLGPPAHPRIGGGETPQTLSLEQIVAVGK